MIVFIRLSSVFLASFFMLVQRTKITIRPDNLPGWLALQGAGWRSKMLAFE
jgi:hypothetical protein